MMNENPDSLPYSLKRIRAAVFILYFCQGLVFASWASRIPNIKSAFGFDDATWGTLLFMIPIGQLCGMVFSGFLVSQLGSKKILAISFPLYAISLLAIGFSVNPHTLTLCMILFGVTSNFANISVNTQGVNVENIYNKSIMSSFHGGWSLAGFIGSLIGLLMINLNLNPARHFVIVAAVVIVLMFLNLKYLQPDINKNTEVKDDADKRQKKRKKPEKFLFLLGLTAFCSMTVEGTMFDWSGIYFEDVIEIEDKLVPIGFAAFMVTMALGRFVADHAIQKWGRKRIVQISGILMFSGLLLSAVFPHVITSTIAFMIVGAGTSSIVPSIFSIAGKNTRIPVGLALTIVSSISFFGFLLGPPLIGYISHASSLRYSFGIFAAMGLAVTLLSSKIKVFREEK